MTTSTIFSLAGKRALVTGAGRGLGAAISRGLADAEARVALVARSANEIATTAEQIGDRAVALRADVSAIDELSDLVDRAEFALGGPIDVVVHGAGIQHRENAESFSLEDWERVMTVNVSAPFFLSQEVGRRQLGDGRSGSHIFIGSLTSRLSVMRTTAYTASKSAIFGVIRNLSLEWSSRGVRANGIGPGYIHTALTRELFEDPQRRQHILDRIPMGRLGQPEDMVGAALFLASDASSYVTGQLIMVDGGWSAS